MTSSRQKKPNILLITTDQQRFDTIAAAGNPVIETPNLDRLAREGRLYTNAYSPNPVCIPARHNIITGLSARYHGFDDNYFDESRNIPYEIPTFPQVLSDGGYDTVALGKMHFMPDRRMNGFLRASFMTEVPAYREDDEYTMFLQEQGYGNITSVHGFRNLLYMLPQRSVVPTELHGSTWVADQTIDYLDSNRGRRPFMVWSSFIHPHPPFDVPDDWADMYKGAQLPPLPETVTPLSALAEENKHIADYPTPEYLQRARELYYAAISFVDYNIGRILEKLEAIGELENTLIVFTSDHGEMLGDLGTYQKFLPYDGSAKIPFIVRYPKRVEAGTVCDDMVDLNDLLPTFLDVAGLPYPADYDLPGASLFDESGRKDRGHQYLEHCKGNRRWCSLRNRRYKYNYYYGGGYEELFDMVADPHETTNLLYGEISPAVQAVRDDLRARLVQEEARQGLPGCVVEGDFVKLPPYESRPYRETVYHVFADRLVREEEIAAMTPMADEILCAIKGEPVVKLEDLDLETFQKHSGFTDEEIADLVRRAKAQRGEQ